MPDITEPTKEGIEAVIAGEDLDSLLNKEETSWFEFREKHYATTSPEPGGSKAKYELAKDCSSIANSGGGYIFIGLKPAISESQMTEYVTAIPGIKKADINLTSWRDSLMHALTPRFSLEDIEHGYIDIDDENSVLWMRIPSAEEKGVYPLILHSDQVQLEGHRLRGSVIGVYERHGAENVQLSPEKIQGYVSQGIANENTGQPYSQVINRVEAKLDNLMNSQITTEPAIDIDARKNKHLEIARRKVGDDSEAFFYIYAGPKTKTKINNFWDPYTEETSIPHLMKNPPVLRRMGWDLSVADQEYPTAEPGAWEIMNGNRKLLNVTERGEVFSAGTLNRFLNWGLDELAQQSQDYGLLINEYALAEYVAMFFSFLQEVSQKLSVEGVQYEVRFGFVGTDGLSVGLHEPLMPGIPSNGTLGPMRDPSEWAIDDIEPLKPYINAGFVIQEIIRAGFGGTENSQYFVREQGQLVFDHTSYVRR